MPLKSIVRTNPWGVMAALTILSIGMNYVLREIASRLAGPPGEQNAVAAAELVCVLFAIIMAALITPSMPFLDLRRRRAKRLALGRLLVAGVAVAVVSATGSYFTILAYHAEVGRTDVSPEAELIIHNALLVFAIAGILITLLGKLVGIHLTIALWLAGMSPLVFSYTVTLWPFAALREAGPWFSPPHIAVSAGALLIAGTLQYTCAGVAKATRSDDT